VPIDDGDQRNVEFESTWRSPAADYERGGQTEHASIRHLALRFYRGIGTESTELDRPGDR